MGCFLFGGGDIVMIFQRQAQFTMLASEDGEGGYQHRLMGEVYAELSLASDAKAPDRFTRGQRIASLFIMLLLD